MTAVLVVQARMGSTRLPGKVLANISGKPMLQIQLERLQPLRSTNVVQHIVVATSNTSVDDRIVAVASRHGSGVVRGSESDVLGRFGAVLDRYPCDVIVRITGDCPLVDPVIVASTIVRLAQSGADYASNTLIRTFPDGLDVEVMTSSALRLAIVEAADPQEREHVTPFLYRRPNRFRLVAVIAPRDLSGERWTVDTGEDLDRIRYIVKQLGGTACSWTDALGLVAPPSVPPGICFRTALPDTREAPAPVSDPGRRIWLVELNGERVGWVRVTAEAGVGAVTYGLKPKVHPPEVLGAIASRFNSDLQVNCLDVDGGALSGDELEGKGFHPVGGSRFRWSGG